VINDEEMTKGEKVMNKMMKSTSDKEAFFFVLSQIFFLMHGLLAILFLNFYFFLKKKLMKLFFTSGLWTRCVYFILLF